MTRLLDGPAAREVLMLRRAPRYLRVVFNPRKHHDQWDALDQLADEPAPHERLTAYVRVKVGGWTHIKGSRRGASGFYPNAEYRGGRPQPDDATMRDRERWRAWCWERARAAE